MRRDYEFWVGHREQCSMEDRMLGAKRLSAARNSGLRDRLIHELRLDNPFMTEDAWQFMMNQSKERQRQIRVRGLA